MTKGVSMGLGNLSDSSLSDRVIERLREAILSGELSPGERLVERKLADELGVSHIPLREALAILTEERLVERRPRRGARVAVLSEQDLEEISSLRVVLEQFVAVRVQERWTPAAEEQLRTIVVEMTRAAEAGDVAGMFRFDRDFHQTLWELSEHGLVVDFAAKLRGRINGFLLAANSSLGAEELTTHAETHLGIIEALAGEDQDHVRAVVAEHIQEAAQRIVAVRALEGNRSTSPR